MTNASVPYPRDLRVLMVDDNNLSRLLARAVLKNLGWQMDEAENGKQALEKIRCNQYDLVLMDIQMPEMDGIEATLKIRADIEATYSQVPIIACSPETTDLMWKEAGMNDCISKPFNGEELARKAMALIKNNLPAGLSNETGQTKNEEINGNAGQTGIVNLQKLTTLSGNSKATIKNIVNVFLKQVPGQMENLIIFVDRKDWKNVKALTHKMKSSYAIIGADSVRRLLETMETACKPDDIDENHFKHLMEKVIVLNEEVIKSISTIAA